MLTSTYESFEQLFAWQRLPANFAEARWRISYPGLQKCPKAVRYYSSVEAAFLGFCPPVNARRGRLLERIFADMVRLLEISTLQSLRRFAVILNMAD
jgi:hypothetical protein